MKPDRRARAPRRGAAVLAAVAALALGAGCGGGRAPAARPALDLVNPQLGPDWASWLVGPVARMATPAEVDAFLALKSDADAARFVDEFWTKRNPNPLAATNRARETFARRAADADKFYAEAGVPGRHTDRGTIFVLFGPPQSVDHEINPAPSGPPIEVWIYDPKGAPGLTGKPPLSRYRFVRRGDLTVFYEQPTWAGP